MQQFNRVVSFIIKYVYAFVSCCYLFLVGFIFSKNRFLINQICINFGLDIKRIRPMISKSKFSEIVNTQLPVKIIKGEGTDGNTSLFELLIINLFVKTFNPNSIFGIGTFDGRTTLNLAINSLPAAKIYTIDLPKADTIPPTLFVTPGDKKYIEKNVTGIRYHNKDEKVLPEKNKIIQLYGDTAKFNFNPYFNKINMVFVDAAHSYEYVLNDSKIALKLLKNGKGIILWHDYDVWDGVTQALNELQQQNSKFNSCFHIEGRV